MLYYRETLFKKNDINYMINIPDNEFDTIINLYKLKIELKESLISDLHCYQEKLFHDDLKELSKQIMKVTRRIKNDKVFCHKALSENTDINVIKKIKDYDEHLKLINEKEKLLLEYFNKENFEYFLSNKKFSDAIKYINTNSQFILDEEKYNKLSNKKTRYDYVQRAIMKTSPLSWLGFSKFVDNLSVFREKVEINNFLITLIVLVISQSKDSRHKMKWKMNRVMLLNNRKVYYHKKYYINTNLDFFIVKKNEIYNKEFINFIENLHKFVNIDYSVNLYEDVEHFCNNDSYYDIDTLVYNNIIYPDFEHYFDDDHFRILLLKCIPALKNVGLIDLESKIYREAIYEYILDNHNKIYGDITYDYISRIPVLYHNVKSIDIKNCDEFYINAKKIFIQNKENLLRAVVENKRHIYILNAIKHKISLGSSDDLYSLVSIFTYDELYNIKDDVEKGINFDSKLKLIQKKNVLCFGHIVNNNLFVNNVYTGNGYLFGRELPYLTKNLRSSFYEHLAMISENNYEDYELIFGVEESSRLDVGNSELKKLYWPEDFLKVSVKFSENEILFIYKDKPINIHYLGSIPNHLFFGEIGNLLNIITPWSLSQNTAKKANSKIHTESISIGYDEIIDKHNYSSDEKVLRVIELFSIRKYPTEFFIEGEISYENNNFLNIKPVYINLKNKTSILVFIEHLKKRKKVGISNVRNCDEVNAREYCCLYRED